MFSRKKIPTFRRDFWGETELIGDISLEISSIKPYDKLWFKFPMNNASCLAYVPLAIRIKGKIIDQKNVNFDAPFAYFLIPEPDLMEVSPILNRGDRIKLFLAKKCRCIKFEKIN